MSSSYNENSEDFDEEDDKSKNSTAECIRNRTNFSVVKPFHLLDKKEFNADMLNLYIENDAAPKLKLLLENIKKLDKNDLQKTGKLYKHMIFTDVSRSAYGVKIIASALAAAGMNLAMHPQGTGFAIYPDEKLLDKRHTNFGVLISKAFYDRPLNVKTRKLLMEKFNSRPDNVHGELIRFIILDQGFKEGIDLYDVKYVHLFEPLTVPADEKQAIGRGTRFCGQKGLEFHPRFGWPLYVFKYDVTVDAGKYGDANTLFELYLKYSNIDLRKITFAAELENAVIEASVDYELNRSVHTFTVENPSPIIKSSRSQYGGADPLPPKKKLGLQKMREYISEHFGQFAYPELKLENNCMSGGNGTIVTFTPTQDFVRHYFQPSSAYKGILFYHSVGTGKTCSAIATATTSFEAEGYTILWVTRHTLKADIWKNMYNQVCSLDLQDKIRNGMKLPNKISGNLRYVSNNWLEPISYKQFSNMLLKKNKIYDQMVRRNGQEDPLRKTLLIIDEAHKLYSPTVAKNEKPDTDILEKMIQNSYDVSDADSVRILLMTATPFTEDGMEMMKLLNLLKEGNKFKTSFDEFADEFLNDEGYFTLRGLRSFQNRISGYVSYLNRSQDARNFAHPVLQNVYAPMSYESTDTEKPRSKYDVKLADLRANMKDITVQLKELKKDKNSDLKELKQHAKEKTKECTENANMQFKARMENEKQSKNERDTKCKQLPTKSRKECKDKSTALFKDAQEMLKAEKESELQKCSEIKQNMLNTANMSSKIDDLKDSAKEYRDEIKKISTIKKRRNAEAKDIRETIKDLRSMLRSTLNDYKDVTSKIKDKSKKIRKISDKKERAETMKEFRKTSELPKQAKELKYKVKDLRATITQNTNILHSMYYEDGKKKLKNISQAYSLAKHCKV